MGKLLKTIIEDNNNEIAMIRVDESMKDLMGAQPSSRWDPDFWHPKYLEIMNKINLETKLLGDFIPEGTEGITYGAIITKRKNKSDAKGICVVGANEILKTGLDLTKAEKTSPNSDWDPERSRAYANDLLFVRSGVGSLGKSIVYVGNNYVNVGCFVDRIRLNGISSFYVDIYLKTIFGQMQIERLYAGVAGTTNISFDQIKSIAIPVLGNKIQKNIENEYYKMNSFHEKAMQARYEKDNKSYNKYIKDAENVLFNLIARTEAVIKGEREDVV